MKRRRGCIKWAVIALCSLVALALLVLCPLAFLYTRQLDQARAEYEPPTVYIIEPASGTSVPSGTGLLVAATAVGRTPITRVELWAADELVETLESEVPEGMSSFAASFEFIVSEGSNLLFVRAVNTAGIIGQSAPVSVFGEPLSPGDIVTEVTVEEGQTLEDIADSYEVDPGTLQQLNPDLGGQQPPPGTSVTVPAPEREEDDEHVAPPSVGPSVPSTPPESVQVPMPPVPPLGSLPTLPGPIAPGPFLPPPSGVHTSTVPTAPWPVMVGVVLRPVIPVFTPPAAPTGLQGYVEDCMVHLRWTDNAGDELRYELWMAPMGGSKRLLASLQPSGGGPAWVKFAAPLTGGLSFWVEAVNVVGKQPSNIVWIEVDPSCPTAAPDRLQIEVVDMTTGGAYDRVYFYVAFEDTPEVRMPGEDSDFVQVRGGRADLAAEPAQSHTFVLPIPGDESLEVGGECWGWSGDNLSRMGIFSAAYPRDTWDGTRRPLRGQDCEIGVTIQPLGGEDTRVTYSYRDSTIPAPFNLREEKIGQEPRKDLDPMQWQQWFLNRRLRWDWTGSQQVTGFTIFLNGVEYKSVQGANVRDASVTLPALYDRRIQWQVAADVGEAQSPLSQELAYDLPKSRAYVQVDFSDIYWTYTCDGCCCGDCSTCEAYGFLSLGMAGHQASKPCASLWDTNSVKCGNTYSFFSLCSTDGTLDDVGNYVLILPFDKESKDFTIYLRVSINDDDGRWSGNDKIADYRISHTFSSLQHAQSALGCKGKQFMEADSSKDGASRMNYWLTVFPNACFQEPTWPSAYWGVHH
jgi:LysM repeat protein